MRGRHYWIGGGLGLCFALLVWSRAELNPYGGAVRIADVQVAPVSAQSPPESASPLWRSLRLPHDWSPRGDGRDLWLRARFSLQEAPARPLQLLIAQVAFGAEIHLNGEPLGIVGRGAGGVWGRREVVWLPIPARSFRAGSNELLIKLRVRPEFAGYLTPIFVGSAVDLQGAYRARNALISGPDVLVIVSATLALVYFGVYQRMRRSEWAWLGVAIAALAIGGLPLRSIDFVLWPMTIGVAAVCVICAGHRGGHLDRPGVERAAFGGLALLASAALLAPATARYGIALAASIFSVAAASYLVRLYGSARLAGWIAGTTSLRAALVLSLLWALNDVPQFWGRAPIIGLPLLPVVHLPILVASFVHIIGFLADGLAREVALNASLQESQARLLALERRQAARAERERMQRDLHDGLGAQLVSALAVAEREPHDAAAVQRSLRGALGELRVAVDSLDGDERDLTDVLGALRARIEPQLAGTGIELRWGVANLERPPRLSPQQAVHLLRIVQEAVANAVKHAGARKLEVACGEAEHANGRSAFVAVRDDGRGFAGETRGRGLPNMRSRAAQLGGELAIESSSAGTRVVLWLSPALTP